MEAKEFIKTIEDEFDVETLELMKSLIEKRLTLLNTMMDVDTKKQISPPNGILYSYPVNHVFKINDKYKKYIKILTELSNGSQQSVWGFIVASENDKKFQVGDILMAAGWRGPARNKARGNVLSGNFGSSWTGPNYL